MTVPDFVGMNRQQASDAALESGLYILATGNLKLSPDVKVTAQSVQPGTSVAVGTTVRLEFTDKKAAD